MGLLHDCLGESPGPARSCMAQPGALAHIPVVSDFAGRGTMKGKSSLYHKHGLPVAQVPGIKEAERSLTIQVMHLSVTPLRWTTRQVVAFIERHADPAFKVTTGDMEALSHPVGTGTPIASVNQWAPGPPKAMGDDCSGWRGPRGPVSRGPPADPT